MMMKVNFNNQIRSTRGVPTRKPGVEDHGKARQRPGVRRPSAAFEASGTHPERQRTGALQNLADHFGRARLRVGLTSNLKLESSNFSERGVALVITLILLSVITFMAIAFLVISRHASEAVTGVTQQVIAKQAAADAVQQVEANVIAAMQQQTNGFNFGPFVSQNYQSPFFTNAGPNVASVANVNYFDNAGNLLDYRSAGYLQMLNNMLILPRAPVVITTNPAFAPDFRFYLDLNRNRAYDQTGQFPFVDQFGQTNFGTIGDPDWIGVLEHPDQPHSRSNFFAARYAFFAQPIGNSLDINFIHNQVKQLNPAQDGFLRNQGVGSWEINLAGFLNGLNPNYWIYGNGLQPPNYTGLDTNTPGGPLGYQFSLGTAFEDSAAIMRFRSRGSYFLLPTFASTYVPTLYSIFPPPPGIIDYYSAGALMSGEAPPILTENFNANWSGGGNNNQMFTSQDFFNAQNSTFLGNFPVRLANAGVNAGLPAVPVGDINFNRYTYYRMLAQMGTESAPEPETKLNLNYVNIGGYANSNFVPWTDRLIEFPRGSGIKVNAALVFFTNAANRLFTAQTNFIVPLSWGPGIYSVPTNISTGFIPVYPTNYYTPSVQRVLQLAANIYDAANPKVITNAADPNEFDYPSVFRPIFGANFITDPRVPNIWVKGYVEVTNTDTNTADYNFPTYSLSVTADRVAVLTSIGRGSNNFNIYGVPWIIGAKKGLPNFNQISLQSFSSLTRKLQITKPGGPASGRATWHTNVQYVLSVSNAIMAEAWNSYISAYPRAVDIGGIDTLNMTLTNEHGIISPAAAYSVNTNFGLIVPTIPASTWQGVGLNLSSNIGGSFRFPLLASTTFLPGDIYSTNTVPNGTFVYVANPFDAGFESTTGYPLPRLGMNLTNRLRFVMVDHATGRVIDYVQLDGMGGQRDFTGFAELDGNDYWGPGAVWDTNRMILGSGNPNVSIYGIENQIQASQQMPPFNSGDPNLPPQAQGGTPLLMTDWQNALAPGFNGSVQAAVTQFKNFFNGTNAGTSIQVPFTPTRTVCVYYTWQANDPLVHYTLPDLTDLIGATGAPITNWVYTNLINGSLGQINKRYMPWGVLLNGGNSDYNNNMTLKDPQVTRSDDWQFPNSKVPGIGWLGRVHRGTPWQTVYMKSLPVDAALWQNWTGNNLLRPDVILANQTFDSTFSQPINDWGIFDLFTTAPNDNATRGQLSINQTNFAAWAAVLDGVTVLSNDPVNGLVPVVIDPNAANGAVPTIVASIANARANTVLPGGVAGVRPGGVFTRLGDILGAPALSVASPFVNIDPNNPIQPDDEVYERLPQQIMSLLRVGEPRYVIYAYGQSLKPAERSIVSSGQFYGTCTNYQITGEVVTRTVVRFEPVTAPSPTNAYTAFNPTHNPVMPQMFPLPNGPGAVPRPQPQIRAVVESFTVLPPE